MKQTVIITAGGIGKRMGSAIPKQFISIKGWPILMHTIHCFHAYNSDFQLIVTLPNDWKAHWLELCKKHHFSIDHLICEGGSERYFSIKNALPLATGTLIAVHDGVRPFPSVATLDRCFTKAQLTGNAIPVVDLKDSLRFINDNDYSTVLDRQLVKAVQTPQVFEKSLLEKAYNGAFHTGITDDASLVEALGVKIHLVEGNDENVKITTPLDVKLAELLATKKP